MNKKAVVLGAYGFIGSACVRALQKKDFSVCGVGRSSKLANAEFPDIEWSIRNIAHTSIGAWKQLLADADVVVNASGTLQDGARDNLKAIHETAVSNICDALVGTRTKLIQISAAGVTEDAPTDFFRTKARGDAIIMSSDIEWIVLRPVLVLGSQAYGGTALLRAAAAFPAVQCMIMPEAKVQTIHVGDLADAVAEAAEGRIGTRFVADLTETGSQTFSELTEKLRAWLGFPAWRFRVKVPAWSLKMLGRGADALGWLGWRSPLRTNALRSLEAGITGDPDTWKRLGGAPLKSLRETLDEMPATAQERMFSRLYLALPLAIGCLSLFWLLSGMFGLVSFSQATAVLTDQGVSASLAAGAVVSGSIFDVGLGLAVLFRRWTRLACLGMIALSAVYLVAGTILTPHLWLDPLGVFVKVLPGMALALLVALVLEER